MPFLPIVLFGSAALAWWPALMLRRRDALAERRVLLWLMAAVSMWCATSALHALVPTLAAKVALAKIQYVAICSVAPLWLLLVAEYAGVEWFATVAPAAAVATQRPRTTRRALIGLWTIPVLTMMAAATNEWHGAVWSRIHLEAGRAVYDHGWWFNVALGFNYVALTIGTVLLVRTLRRTPPPFHAQTLALIVAALFPFLGNVLYVTGAVIPGLDPTPLAFTASGLLFAWGMYRNHLFDLIPVAREMVVEDLSDAVVVLDPQRRIVDLNAAAKALIGGERGIGEPVDAVLPFLAGTQLAESSGVSPSLVVTSGEAVTHYGVRVIPLKARSARRGSYGSAPRAWVMLLRDVTAQRAAAAERQVLRERVQEQQRRAGLSILAGGMAHDFNNLLAAIVGHADLLAMQVPPSSEMGNSVGAILLGAQRAADLVSKMLAYAGERHGSVEELDLDMLVRDLLHLLRASVGRHCTIHHKGQSATIVGDRTQIRQVLMNLIINAADAVDEGTGRICITTGVERLTTAQLSAVEFGCDAIPGRYAFLDVGDNGCGMDADTVRRIFDPFFTTKATGHGLGLAAVQGIVHGHHGALRVESDPSWGTRFRVWFPMTAADPALRSEHDVTASLVGSAPSN